MSSVKVHVIGRLGADAEVKQTRQGKEFSTFNLAVDDFVGGKRTTTWFAVADFSNEAKRRAEYLKRGSMVEVQGLETCRIYTDRNNLPQIARDIRSTHIDFVTMGNRTEKEENIDCGELSKSTENLPKAAVEVAATTVASSVASESSLIDDLPF